MLKNLFNLTYLGIIINTVISYFKFQALKSRIGKVFYSDQFKSILSQYLGVRNIKQDRIGRLYCIVNPDLNSQGIYDTNMIIYELDAQGLQFSNQKYIETWLLKKLRIIQDLFKQRNLFSELAFTTDHVGPINQDNFLIKIYPTYFDDFDYFWKRFLKRTLIWTILIVLFLIAKYIFLF